MSEGEKTVGNLIDTISKIPNKSFGVYIRNIAGHIDSCNMVEIRESECDNEIVFACEAKEDVGIFTIGQLEELLSGIEIRNYRTLLRSNGLFTTPCSVVYGDHHGDKFLMLGGDSE